jgi:hypothetical protein
MAFDKVFAMVDVNILVLIDQNVNILVVLTRFLKLKDAKC